MVCCCRPSVSTKTIKLNGKTLTVKYTNGKEKDIPLPIEDHDIEVISLGGEYIGNVVDAKKSEN